MSIIIKSNDVRLNDNCSICFDPIKDKDKDKELMCSERCGHIFHRACLETHMGTPSEYNSVRKTCPLCREALSDVSILHLDATGTYEKVGHTAARLLPQDRPLIYSSIFTSSGPLESLLNWAPSIIFAAAIFLMGFYRDSVA